MVKLIIGLDFGTTFSGVAYAEDSNRDIRLLTEWPGKYGGDMDKTPSRIAYGPPPEAVVKWGYMIKPTDKARVFSLMKLKLDKDLGKNKLLRRLLAALSNDLRGLRLDSSDDEDDEASSEYPNKEPVDMVADYLTEIRKHCELEWIKQYGDIFHTLEKEIIVTVPAVWKESAKDATVQAVKRAGFVGPEERICMITEPEAAAIYTLKGMSEGAQKESIKVGDVFVLCDAGGGTVDLISYKVTQTSPTFKIEEAAVGTGAKCGASFIEEEFLKWLKGWIGPVAYDKIPKEKLLHGSQLISSFETAKMQFDGVQDDNSVSLPRECGISDDDTLNIDDKMLAITTDQMKAIMDPCVNRTLELVDGQVASLMKNGCSKPKMVILVGGFGKNNYLFNQVSEYCKQRGILTRRPSAPWSAVARGAVCRGLEGVQGGLVAVRLARKHYGTYASEMYREGFHHADDMYIDEFTGYKYAKGQMTWLIEKGERLPETCPKKVSISVSRSFKMGESREIGAVLVGCLADEAPQRYQDDSAHNICRVSASLDHIPEHKLTRARSRLGGEEYFVADVELEATFQGGEVQWKLIFDGEVHGSVTVSYNK